MHWLGKRYGVVLTGSGLYIQPGPVGWIPVINLRETLVSALYPVFTRFSNCKLPNAIHVYRKPVYFLKKNRNLIVGSIFSFSRKLFFVSLFYLHVFIYIYTRFKLFFHCDCYNTLVIVPQYLLLVLKATNLGRSSFETT